MTSEPDPGPDAATAPKTEPSAADIEAFARRHGFGRLPPEHLARMAELAPRIAQVAASLPRPPRKSDAPAERSRILKATT